MSTFTVSYDTLFRFKDFHDFEITKCRKVFNAKTGKMKKQVRQGGSFGYKFGKKFIPSSKLKQSIEKIPFIELPF